jgi:hypothetical protein
VKKNIFCFRNPTPEITDLLPVEWPVMTEESLSYMNIDLNLEVLQRPSHDRMAYWDLFFKLNQKYQPGFKEN